MSTDRDGAMLREARDDQVLVAEEPIEEDAVPGALGLRVLGEHLGHAVDATAAVQFQGSRTIFPNLPPAANAS